MALNAPRLRLIALIAAIAAIAVVVILLIGGGDQSPEEAAEGAADQFVSAVEEGDFETACGLLTDELRSGIGGDQCPDRLGATVGQAGEDLAIEVVDVRVSGPKAAAATEARRTEGPPAESSFELQLVGDEWLVSRLGS